MTEHDRFGRFHRPAVELTHSGAHQIFRCLEPLEHFDRCVTDWLARRALKSPERIFLAQRHDDNWLNETYASAYEKIQNIAQGLIDAELGPDRPLMILSGNGIDFALLQLAAMHVGVPVAPVSPAYSLVSKKFGQLNHVYDLVTPGLVYAANDNAFEPALRLLADKGAQLLVGQDSDKGLKVTLLDTLLNTEPSAAVADVHASVTKDHIAKFLFTSGSTGVPKGVINTHRMLCSNQQAIAQLWPFVDAEPPVMVDWLPWHHTFGGNFVFNLVLRNGGTLYIDEGKPAPGLIETTLRNLSEISPSLYFNVPAGFQTLLPHLERDSQLCKSFFRQLRIVFYAAAALPREIWDRLEKLARQSAQHDVAFLSAWGSTETAPLSTQTARPTPRPGAIGTPVPGTELKLCQSGDKTEVRVRGPNVTPGYWRQPELTAAAFDEDGFYRMGDAVRLADPNNPAEGLVFDGRVAEDFKLTTGTWVNVGQLRTAVVGACSPLVQDAVITGHNRDEVGALLMLSPAGCADTCAESVEGLTLAELAASEEVRSAIGKLLRDYNAHNTARTKRIARVILLTEPFSIDRGELTDKGYVNQRAVLDYRAEAVERLYRDHSQVLSL